MVKKEWLITKFPDNLNIKVESNESRINILSRVFPPSDLWLKVKN